VLRPLQSLFTQADYPDLLVGLGDPDDAAVWRLDETRSLVVTTDFFTPVVDDAYDFGVIAAANALSEEGTSRLKAEDLTIIRVQVDDGPRAKRVRFRAMGRVYRYKKRLAHLTVVVEGEPKEEAAASKKRGAATKAAVAAGPVTEKTKKVRKTSAIKKIATKAAAGAKAAGKAAGKATTRKTAAKKKPARPDGAQGKAEQSASTDKGEE